MGGMLATRFALLYPERVERLVLVNPIGLEDYRVGVPYRTVDDIYRQELLATPESIREYQKKSYYGGEWKPEYEKLIEAGAGQTNHPEYRRVAWDAALTSDMIMTQPVVHEFSSLRVPTLLIIGLRDRTAVGAAWAPKEVAERMGDYTRLGKRTAALIPNARLVELPGVGHLPQVEAFEQYRDALLSFLK
jgi:pimeloyl-ACP methyl ester carboxylesterase